MRHGLTIGELAVLFKAWYKLDVDLDVIWMQGWQREMLLDTTGLPWVMPSPNMPTLNTALVYPGACLLEGTAVSEGRGTTRPFEIFGAPYVEPDLLVSRLTELDLPGCYFRPMFFQPTFHKFADQVCGGAQVHVTDRDLFESVLVYTAIIGVIHALWPKEFAWKQPPYEYETEKLPIDILAGGTRWRKHIEAGLTPWVMQEEWAEPVAEFQARSAEYRHYE